ncbi:hypothethical protein (plasmid) [Ralstonia solanacearum PSI07]|nr:hypothethical protein [Ralstonia solanacearum PSI07]
MSGRCDHVRPWTGVPPGRRGSAGANPSLPQRTQFLQQRRQQFRHGRVDVHRAADRGVRGVRVHRVEQRMDDFITRHAQDRRPQDRSGVRVDDHLHEALAFAFLHGAAHARHRARADQQPAPRLHRFGLRHAGAAERRVDEHGVCRDAVRHLARAALEQVGRDDFVVVVRGVGERAAAVAVAQCPDAGDIGAQLLVHPDVAARVGLDPGLVQPEIAGVRHAPDGEQQMRACGLAGPGGTVQPDDHVVRVAPRAQAVGAELDVDPFVFQDLPHRLRYVFVFALDQARAFLHDRHAGAEAPVHLPELEPHVAAADDDQVLRQEVHVHHARVGEIGHLVQARHGRDQRASADVDEDPLGFQPFVADAHGVRAFEAGMALIDHAVLQAADPLLHAMAGAPRNLVLARLHPLHVDRDRPADRHAVRVGPSGQVGRIGTGDQRLGGNAAGVHARAAESRPLDDGHPHARAGQPRGQRRAGLPGADDDGVEALRHGALLRCCDSVRAALRAAAAALATRCPGGMVVLARANGRTHYGGFAFWRRGYELAFVAELCAAMGQRLHRWRNLSSTAGGDVDSSFFLNRPQSCASAPSARFSPALKLKSFADLFYPNF